MAAKKETETYLNLVKRVADGQFAPIYVLQGEEPYYIDSLADKIVDAALREDDKDFNLTVTYGIDCNVRELIATCRRYPMMAERQVVVLKEAQNVKETGGNSLELLKFYAENPQRTTILVVCHKGGNIKAPEFLKTMLANGTGVLMESPKEREGNIMSLITRYVASKGCTIKEKAASMMRDYVGTDLSRLFGEVDKLCILVNEKKEITPEMIERNIGISKDYNIFELEDALMNRNRLKTFRIIDYFEKDQKSQKENPVQRFIVNVFNLYASLLLIRTSRDKSPSALKELVGTASQYRADKFAKAAANYTTAACVNCISLIRRFDAQSKGNGSQRNTYDLLRELMFNILNS